MTTEISEEKLLLVHHVQQELCTTRLPYRQGRKFTAVKAYTINNESNHLLIFGVPSLKLRQEARNHFLKFGKLLQFSISPNHAAEQFTETYHAVYEKIQSARMAKRMLDTKTFYGGSLHICYAPEFETLEETRQKLLQRQKDVLNRLKNLQKQVHVDNKAKEIKHEDVRSTELVEKVYIGPNLPSDVNVVSVQSTEKLNMGNINTICIGKQIRDVVLNKKRKNKDKIVIDKKFKPYNIDKTDESSNRKELYETGSEKEIEIVDCTSAERDTVTNIDEALNYKKFGNETVVNIPNKPLNKIKFNIPNIKL